jgi:predicted nucleic acid-binding protein
VSAGTAVVDASVWISSLSPGEVGHLPSRRWLTAHLGTGGQVIAPALLLVEVAGAVARRSGDALLGELAMNAVLILPALYLIELDGRLSMHAARLAADLRLRGADAVYVALAHQLGIPLITWDREQLTRAAARIAVQTP